MNDKPDWKDAPEWARFLAMDMNSCWWWYQEKPTMNLSTSEWEAKKRSLIQVAKINVPLWQETLEERPQ
jgi:hypothetical protein